MAAARSNRDGLLCDEWRTPTLRATGDSAVRVRAAARAGPHQLYAGSYSEQDLRWWAERLGEWDQQGHDVYIYFNNDGEGHAVRNAERLRELLGV